MENRINRITESRKSLIIALITLSLTFVSTSSFAGRNFYFSSTSGNDSRTSTQAQNPSTPWKSINKLNTFFSSLLPGDSVLFKRGDTFYGSIVIGNSGSSSLPIVLGAYGTGSKPIITAFTTITSWTSIGNGIYESAPTTCKSTLNMVTVNGVNTPIGRYPNTSFLSFESHIGITSITDNQLTGTPNWTGAEVVIRKSKYNIGRNKITNHTANTITYSGGGEIPFDNFGYFIQNDPKTLDKFGEWYLNPTTKKMQVYFGSINPTAVTIMVSTLDTLINCRYRSYVNISNLNFEGANSAAVCINGGQNISILSCGINFSGNYGVYTGNSPNVKIENCSINNCNHNSIQLFSDDASVKFNTIKNSGIIPGMAKESSGYNGIEITDGDRNLIEYNALDSIGKHGILLRGNDAVIKNNLINHFACLLDDVGGIYTVGSFTGRKIIGNIVLNGLGNESGTTSTSPGVKGIFLEVSSSFIEITDNTVANSSVSGLHFNNSHDIIVRKNLFYNNKYQFLSQNTSTNPVDYTRNLSIYHNIFFSKVQSQVTMRMYSIRNDIALFGQADSNYYCRPIDDVNVINTQEISTSINRTLAGWQSFSGKDPHSKKSPQTITNENDILFEYNASLVNKVVPLNAIYLGVDGTLYMNSITLQPYKSIVLIKSINQNLNLAPTIQNQNFQINENSPNGSIAGNVIASDPNAGQLLTYSILSGNTSGAFAINASSGILTVANSSTLNFEAITSFNLIVKVQDNGVGNLSNQATITITLLNVNEAPIINNQTFSVDKNSANGTNIGTIIATDPDVGQSKTYTIVSGNTNNIFAINASSGVLTVANSTALNAQIAVSYALGVNVQDNGTGQLSGQATITVNVISVNTCTATGNISYQVWNNIGNSIAVSSLTSNSSYPDNPTSSTLITSMEGISNLADGYGARIAGFICAPATGNYTFWIAGDDNCELWLSTNNQTVTKQKIAFHTGYTLSRQWNKYNTQKSLVIYLIQGQSYYVEAIMKEGTGGDNFAVGWLKPGQSGTEPSEVIPGSVLSPINALQTILVTSISLPSVSSLNVGSSITLSATILPVNATNNSLTWNTNNQTIATVNSNGLVTGISPGTATITATSTDGSNISDACLVTVNLPPCTATGNIAYQIWNNIGNGTAVSNLTGNSNYPDNPTSTILINSMEGTTNLADGYGTRIAGYICAPSTGNYTFWIAGDDNCELWLSADYQSGNMQKIAYHTGYTLSREWNKYATQKSVVINLTQGRSYYIEALMKEGTGGDNLAVGWLKPGQSGTVPSEVIPGTVLSPIDVAQTVFVTSVSLPSTASINTGSSFTLSASVLPTNATNSLLNWSTSNPAIATVNNNGLVTGISAGTATITASATDGSNISDICSVTVILPPCTATGNIAYQIWNNIGNGTAVSNLTSNINFPNNPTSTTLITSMEGTTNLSDGFGARIAGYICAPSTGNYTFWVAGDDNCELWLSTDDQQANMQEIAFHTGYTLSREWNKYASQKSIAINLTQGRSYYIEALMKEGTGGDNFAVGWLKPGQTGTGPSEVIPGSVLSPINVIPTIFVTSVSLTLTASVNVGSSVTLSANVLPVNATNNSLNWITSNPLVAIVNNSGLITGISEGTASISATSTDGSNISDNCLVTVIIPPCTAAGNISYQIWNNIGSSVAVSSLTSNVNYPDNPTSTTLITSMEGTTNLGTYFGARIAGFICAPTTGSYTFWIAGDDNCELWLSTNDLEINKQKIAFHTGFTLSREWNKYSTQKSVSINLLQGKSYYIEALMKESIGNDHFAVGWLKPGQSGTEPSEVIPGSVLSPIGNISKSAVANQSFQDIDIELLIYPNPLTGDLLNIKLKNVIDYATLRIYSTSGILYYEQQVSNSSQIVVDRNIFKNGIYILQVFNDSFVKTTKLVIK